MSTTSTQSTMSTASTDSSVTRALIDGITVRKLDRENRRATFVAATETGVLTWGGREHLRMTGVDLRRFKRNPVVLNAHDRSDARSVIGKASCSVDKDQRELICEITFAQTPMAEEIWQLVAGGFINALSVGFVPDPKRTVVLEEGQADGKGDAQVLGPARVIKGWELFEISVVPVPADAEAVRRALQGFAADSAGDAAGPVQGEAPMEKKDATPAAEPKTPAAAPQVPAPAPEQRATNVVPLTQEKPLAVQIRELAPRSLPADTVDGVILRAKDLDEARKLLLEEHSKRLAPVGTPEPKVEKAEKKEEPAPVNDALLIRSVCAPSQF